MFQTDSEHNMRKIRIRYSESVILTERLRLPKSDLFHFCNLLTKRKEGERVGKRELMVGK